MSRPASRLPLVIALVGAGLLAGLALAVTLSLPRLIASAPVAGAVVSARAVVRLTFNRLMDRASIENAVRLEPSGETHFAWDGNTLIVAHPAWAPFTPVTVTLAGGRSASGLPLLDQHTWAFTVSAPRLVYISGAGAHLWVLPITPAAQPQLLDAEPHGVYDFEIAPDGVRLAYAALRADGGADLKLMDLEAGGTATELLACPQAACLSPTFAPDGARLAYQWQSLVPDAAGRMTFGDPEVRVLDLATRETRPVNEAGAPARFPRWGPDGRLGYLDTLRQALVIRDLATGGVTYIPDTSGESGTWSPDGRFIVFPEIFFPPEPVDLLTDTVEHSDRFFSHLLQVEIATNQLQNLSGAGVVEDASPVYSPDGAWLAFGRKGLADTQWTPGRQLWVMRADGTQPRALTDEPFYNHSAFQWSADGTQMVYMRFNATDPAAPAAIWIINADGSGARQLVENGYLPEWLP